MIRRRPLIALLIALLFLAAQQMAFAHPIGHLGAPVEPVAVAGETGHGAVDGLADACTTCVALAALSGGTPLAAAPAAVAGAVVFVVPLPPSLPLPADAAASPYLARAPPAFS